MEILNEGSRKLAWDCEQTHSGSNNGTNEDLT